MLRRNFFLLAFPLALAGSDDKLETVRGRLVVEPSRPPMLKVGAGELIQLEADQASVAVLRDPRMIGEEFEAAGHFTAPGRFRIEPIYRKAMFVVRRGQPLVITYWCEVCAIRTYSPGKCQCCQEETELDPRDPVLEKNAN